MEKAQYVPVEMRKSGETYAMNVVTHQLRRLTPKKYRSKKERVRARRLAEAKR